MAQSKKFYICGVDWQHELGETLVRVYASECHLKKETTCWKECGIVEITVDESNAKWLHPQDFDGQKGDK